jgi:hypothetical protein
MMKEIFYNEKMLCIFHYTSIKSKIMPFCFLHTFQENLQNENNSLTGERKKKKKSR